MLINKTNLKLILICVACIVFLFWNSFLKYENSTATNQRVQGKIIWHKMGGGKFTKDPHYLIELDSNERVMVRSFGELPTTYKGRVVLDVSKGNTSNRKLYNINKIETKKLISKNKTQNLVNN